MSKMKTMKTKTRMNLVGWGFALPAVLGFLIFNLFPMLLSGYYSLCDYNIIGKTLLGRPEKLYRIAERSREDLLDLRKSHRFVFDYGSSCKSDFCIYDCASFEQGYQMQSLLPVVVLPALYSSGSCHELCVAPSDEPGFRPFQHDS
ncbi:MAG: hypothetical protein ACLR6B_00645 [Blautia sp.]